MTIEQVARICHETNKAYCDSIGDQSQKSWVDAEQWQRDSAINGVKFALDNPSAAASAQHEAWLADKEKDGWTFGPVKDPALKQHPYLVPYEALPVYQQTKDSLFIAVVNCFRHSFIQDTVTA